MTEIEAKELLEQLPVYRYEITTQMYQHSDVFNALDLGIKALEEVQQYRALGTVEELKEAKEKQIAKKVIKPKDGLESYYHEESCPNCKEEFRVKVVGYRFTSAMGEVNYCPYCGQKLDWGNEDAD